VRIPKVGDPDRGCWRSVWIAEEIELSNGLAAPLMNVDPKIMTEAVGPWFNPTLSFILVSLIVIVSATVAAFARNIVNAAYSLFFTLLGMAGFYILLGSDFLAVTQVIVYVGGILVLLMFGVLLTNRTEQELQEDGRLFGLAGVVAALFFFVVLAQIIFTSNWGERVESEMIPNTTGIGKGLLTTYVLPFEFSSVTLLVCLIGAAYMARRKES
jgi:NADH:ubiquinone oxidoreductase subunit 6 (subunit J)